MQRLLPWVAAGVAVGLGVYFATAPGPRASDGLAERGTCEARCIDQDAECAPLFAAQGGFPGTDLAPEERAASCRGSCYLLRRTATDPDQPCLR